MDFAYLSCTAKLRISQSGSVLRVLDLYYKVAMFELEWGSVSRDFRVGAAEVYFAY